MYHLKLYVIILFVFNIKPCYNSKFKNVLFIVADDLGILISIWDKNALFFFIFLFIGWSDLGFEDPEIISPNIDYLAKTGVILNHAYTYSTCTPSRNSILSGLYAEHTGLQVNSVRFNSFSLISYK